MRDGGLFGRTLDHSIAQETWLKHRGHGVYRGPTYYSWKLRGTDLFLLVLVRKRLAFAFEGIAVEVVVPIVVAVIGGRTFVVRTVAIAF